MNSTDSDMGAAQTRRGTTWREDSHKDPADLEREIDATRADVQATLGVLEQRLSADHLLDLTIGRVREHGGAFAGNLGSAARDNPVPLLLTSIGIAWMMMSGRNGNGGARATSPGIRERGHAGRDRWDDASQKASERWAQTLDQTNERWQEAKGGLQQQMAGINETLHQARDKAREGLEHSRDTIAQATDSLREQTTRAASATRDQIARARSGVDYLMHEQPLILGALGLAAGALIGAALPASEAENRLVGDARDRAFEKAKQAGGEGYRKVRERAEVLTEKVKQRFAEGNGGTQPSIEGSAERTEAGSSKAAEQGRDYDRPEDYSRAVERSAAERKTPNAPKSKRSKDDPKSLGENPSEPHSRKRPSEGGVGQEHSSGGFSGEKSPTSKTPV